MRLYLKNIGMIKEADVKLDGLTVIAGENDTGKSTVGKSLFALLKANLFVNNDKFHKKTLLRYHLLYLIKIQVNLLHYQ